MKPQKKPAVAQKAQRTPANVAKKRQASSEKITLSDKKKIDKRPHKKLQKPKRTTEDSDRKKVEQPEKRRKAEESRKKAEDKKKEKMEKVEDSRKKCSKESDRKCEAADDKRAEQCDKIEEPENEETCGQVENNRKKNQKPSEEKAKTDKQLTAETKRKNDRVEEKKKPGKVEEIQEDVKKCINVGSEKNPVSDDKNDVSASPKKKCKDEKRKDGRSWKCELKDNSKSPTTKEKKATELKKSPDKETFKKVAANAVTATTTTTPPRKDTKAKQGQKKASTKKTVLAKKSNSPLAKKLIEKKLKLVKIANGEVDDKDAPSEGEQNEVVSGAGASVTAAKSKKKNSIIPKSKAAEKKPKLAKQMKVKLPQTNVKIKSVLKKAKIKKITEKIVTNSKKKIEMKRLGEDPTNDTEKAALSNDEPPNDMNTNDKIKRELCENKEDDKSKEEGPVAKAPETKKSSKSPAKQKLVKKPVKKPTKAAKLQGEESDQVSTKSEDVSLEDLVKQSKSVEDGSKIPANAKREPTEGMIKIDMKVEAVNGEESCAGEASPTSASDSEDDYEEEIESRGRGKQKNVDRRLGKERDSSPTDERARRMRLFGFWSGPKRHRVASLNALAKVHCLYENEAGGVYLGGFCKPKPEKEKPKGKSAKEETKEDAPPKKPKETKKVADPTKLEDNNKRNLRNVPGLRGKHWDMMESSSSSSSSSSSDDDGEREKTAARAKKRNTTRRKKIEEVMDLKDMVVCKRMASLNASAILAASYSDEINRHGSSASDSSSESEVEVIKKRKQIDTDMENKRKSSARQQVSADAGEEVIKPSKKVVIVNQDTDVTITG